MAVDSENGQTESRVGQYVARAARMRDVQQLLELHKCFKRDMKQWEDESKRQTAMDVEDAKYIITEEAGNLIVLARLDPEASAEEHLIAFCYSYIEPFEADNHQRRNQQNGSPKMATQGERESLYIAELYVHSQARGCGLGELLLFETLCRRAKEVSRSHLYVSSKNVGAVRIYENFCFTSLGHSGDVSHDLLMQLNGIWEGLSSRCLSIARKFQHGSQGCVVCQRRCYALRPRNVEAAAEQSTGPTPPPISSPRPRALASPTADGPRKVVPPSFAPSGGCEWCRTHPADLEREEEPEDGDSVRTTRAGEARAALKAKVVMKKEGSGLCKSQRQRYGKAGVINLKGPLATAGLPVDWARTGGVKRVHKGGEGDGERTRVFLLTGFRDGEEMRRVEEGVRRLGGSLCEERGEGGWGCTHVVCPMPLPTEKFLSGLAGGKLMVSAEYVLDSVAAGRFLREGGYEWGSAGMGAGQEEGGQLSKVLAGAVRMWKEARAADAVGRGRAEKRRRVGCFYGMQALLVGGEDGGIGRLLQDGGAEVQRAAAEGWGGEASEVSHAFVSKDALVKEEEEGRGRSGKRWSLGPGQGAGVRELVHRLEAAGASVLRGEYVVDVLTLGPALDEREYEVDAGDCREHRGAP